MGFRYFFLAVLVWMGVPALYAQTTPIGSWLTHLSSAPAYTIESIGDQIWLGGLQIRIYDRVQNEFSTLSKVNGLSDVDVRLIRHDAASGYTLVVYANSNIDLVYEGAVFNMPDLKNYNITGSKVVNNVFFKNQFMYLATDFGIVVLNPLKREIKETYTLQADAKVLEIKDLSVNNGQFYAATPQGIYIADENNPVLQNFANWSLLMNNNAQHLLAHEGQLYFAGTDSLFRIQGNTAEFIYRAESTIRRMRSGLYDFYLCESNDAIREISMFNAQGIKIDSMSADINPRDVVEINSAEIWQADFWEGMVQLKNRKQKNLVKTNEIYSNVTYNLSTYGDAMYVSGGGEKEWILTYNSSGFYRYQDGTWTNYNRMNGTSGMDSILDVMDIAVDPSNQYIYAASYGGGLLEIHPDNTHVLYRNTPYIQSQVGNPNGYIIAGLTMDRNNNLWLSNYAAIDQLVVKKKDGSWQKFSFPYSTSERAASQIVIDDANQKWLMAPRGIGIFVLNDNNTIDNKADDKITKINKGSGLGNLPSNEVYCIEKDKDGKIWVGTADGIAIFNCPESIFSNNGCEAELKIVKYDLNAGLLFQREAVNTIAVDGANNKWVGTNNGVWLISDDAEKIIQRFTKENSPLPTNEIRKIKVHPRTGEVFIATTMGLVSWRGNATDGAESNDQLLVFPNPVPSDYVGTIAITGLVANADVRITDISGQLVYRTKAQGGQAVWNGKNYTGQKPRSGVYYVFVTNEDGSETKAGKFIFNE
ncbi:MAG TPA: hypothetical protein DCF44_06190 [Chitinophagaceae bacterium]|nr:hypothetical protein [Chitinophagaceae bacterium]